MKVMERPKASQADKLAEQIRSEQGELDSLKAQREQADAAAVAAVADDGAYREASAKAQDLKGAVDAKAGRVEHLRRAFTDARKTDLAAAEAAILETKEALDRLNRPAKFKRRFDEMIADAESTNRVWMTSVAENNLDNMQRELGDTLAKIQRTGTPSIKIAELFELAELCRERAAVALERDSVISEFRLKVLRSAIASVYRSLKENSAVAAPPADYVEFMQARKAELERELSEGEKLSAPSAAKLQDVLERINGLRKRIAVEG